MINRMSNGTDTRPDQPYHKSREPYLDDLTTSFWSYDNLGTRNLMTIAVILMLGRQVLENYLKMGIQVTPISWILWLAEPSNFGSYLIVSLLPVIIVISFIIEKLISRGRIQDYSGKILVIINCLMLLTIPIAISYHIKSDFFGMMFALFFVLVVLLKIVSYHVVNSWCRDDLKTNPKPSRNDSHDDKLVRYPHNVTLSDLVYFLFAPTACYQLNYPRSQRIRWKVVFRSFCQIAVVIPFIIGEVQQFTVPICMSVQKALIDKDILVLAEKFLQLTISNFVFWLSGFYLFFHLFPTFMGELLRFADRECYRDWWNATTLPYFWSNWNIPVHKWLVRHVYKPILVRGYTRMQAKIVVYFISGVLHEYMLSPAFQLVRIYGFAAMFSQIIFEEVTQRYLKNYPNVVNVFLWLTLILGQAACIFLYFHDFISVNGIVEFKDDDLRTF